MNILRRTVFVWLSVALFGLSVSMSVAAEKVRVGVLKFGTVNWELSALKAAGLDQENGIDLEIVPYASGDATAVALRGGEVDVIVTDWLEVSRSRAQGDDLTFVPYSTSVGAMMVAGDSPVGSLGDLKGKKIGVAGGPIDKSWLLLQGLAKRDHDIDLSQENEIVYGAPPLLAEKARQGEIDVMLNFWHYCARLEAEGFRRLISAEDAANALGSSGPIAAIGYVFSEKWANENPGAAKGFVAASRAAKMLLETSDEAWIKLQPLVKAKGKSLENLRDRYREGIPKRPIAEEEADAAKLYSVLATLGGEKLVGEGKTMADGTYWSQLKHE